MSFSSNTKDALTSDLPVKLCCKKSLLMGLLTYTNVYGKDKIKMITENRSAAETVINLMSEIYGVKSNLYESIKKTPLSDDDEKRPYTSYKITVSDKREILKMYELFPKNSVSAFRINRDVFGFGCAKCACMYLRGAFISAGTVSRPESSFHLEISSPRKNLINDTAELLNELGVPPHLTVRNSNIVLYYKKCDDIADFLGLIGASSASFDYINESIIRENRGIANRAVNCDTANIKKTVSAAEQSISAIKYIKENGLTDLMPEDLRKTAELRYDNPQSSLSELSEMSEPKLTKSGINHRLNRIIEFAEKHKRGV